MRKITSFNFHLTSNIIGLENHHILIAMKHQVKEKEADNVHSAFMWTGNFSRPIIIHL